MKSRERLGAGEMIGQRSSVTGEAGDSSGTRPGDELGAASTRIRRAMDVPAS